MTFWDDLYEKTGELRTAFKERYAGDFGFMVTEDGGLALEERVAPGYDARKIAECQAAFFELEMLCSRVMQYGNAEPDYYRGKITSLGLDADAGAGAPSWSTFGFLDQTIDLEHMGGVLGLVDGGEWRSQAAQDFEDSFLKAFFTKIGLQREALYDLAQIIAVYQQAAEQIQLDLVAILDNGISALHGSRITVNTNALGVVSLIATAAGLLPLFPLTVPTAILGSVSLGSGFLSTLQSVPAPPQTGKYTIDGDDAPAILRDIAEAVQQFEDALEDTDTNLEASIRSALASRSSYGSPDLDLNLPFATDSPDWGEQWNSNDPALPVEHNQVVVTVADLAEAGQRHLPDTATLYDATRIGIDYFQFSGRSDNRHFWRSRDQVDEVVARLASAFGHARDVLTEVGTGLVTMANNYRLTEEQEAAVFGRGGMLDQRLAEDAEAPVGFPT